MRRFKVLDHVGLGNVDFRGMILDYLHAGIVKNTTCLKQPVVDNNGRKCFGTVAFDNEHIEEVCQGEKGD